MGEKIGVFILLMLLGSGVVVPLSWYGNHRTIQKRAIERGSAYYDTKTGEFTWSDNNVKYIYTGKE